MQGVAKAVKRIDLFWHSTAQISIGIAAQSTVKEMQGMELFSSGYAKSSIAVA